MGLKSAVGGLGAHSGIEALLSLLLAVAPSRLWADATVIPSSDGVASASHGKSVQTRQTASAASLGFTQIPFHPLRNAHAVAVADLNRNGRLDVVRSSLRFGQC